MEAALILCIALYSFDPWRDIFAHRWRESSPFATEDTYFKLLRKWGALWTVCRCNCQAAKKHPLSANCFLVDKIYFGSYFVQKCLIFNTEFQYISNLGYFKFPLSMCKTNNTSISAADVALKWLTLFCIAYWFVFSAKVTKNASWNILKK